MTELTDNAVRHLIDREAIRNVMADYTRALWKKDWESLLDCFVRGASAEYADLGSGSIEEVVEIIRGLPEEVIDFLVLGQDSIRLNGDKAQSEFRVIASHHPLNGEDPRRIGVWTLCYFDEWVRDERGRWLISSRRIEVVSRGSLRSES